MALTTNPPEGRDAQWSALFIAYYDATTAGNHNFSYSNIDDSFSVSVDDEPFQTYGLGANGTLIYNFPIGTHKFVWRYTNTAYHAAGLKFLPTSGGTFYSLSDYTSVVNSSLSSIPNNVSTFNLSSGVRGYVYNSMITLTNASNIPTPYGIFQLRPALDFYSSNRHPTTWPLYDSLILGNCVSPVNSSNIYWGTTNASGIPDQTIVIPAGIIDPAAQTIIVTLNSPTVNDTTTPSFFRYELIGCSFKNPDGLSPRTTWDTQKTWTFSQPVTNPALAIYSLGTPWTRITLSAIGGATYKHLCNSTSPTNSLCIVSPTVLQGAEGYGIIVFSGTHSSITIKTNISEDYTNYAWGVVATDLQNDSGCIECPNPELPPTPTPTPIPLPPCSAFPLDIEFIDSSECLNTSLVKINKNFSALENYMFSLSTCCSFTPCMSCSSYTPPPPTPTPTPPPDPLPGCNIPLSFSSGGVVYPVIFDFELGPDIGNVNLFINALQRPDRFICSIDATIVLDTGYYGANRYTFGQWDRTNFTNRLSGLIDPITGNVYPFSDTNHNTDGYPKVNPAQLDTLGFAKTTSTSTCTLCAFAPMLATLWEINMGCPD